LCASVIVALVVYVIVLEAIISSRVQGSFAMLSVAPSPLPDNGDGTKSLIFLLGVILAGCALLLVQYRRRQRIVSVPTGAGGVMLALLVSGWWPWQMLRSTQPLPEWTAGLRLSAASATAPFDAQSGYADRGEEWRIGRMPLRVGGVAPGWSAITSMRNASVTLPDGAVIATRSRGFSASAAPEDTNEPPQRVAVRHLLS